MILNLFTDGGSRGNPGHAGYGFVVYDISNFSGQNSHLEGAGIVLKKCGKYLGIQTNNQAEYAGLQAGVAWVAKNHPTAQLNTFMDSLLIVNQIKGVYRVKHPQLAVYYRHILAELKNIQQFSIQHIRREYNTVADALANQAMDQQSL